MCSMPFVVVCAVLLALAVANPLPEQLPTSTSTTRSPPTHDPIKQVANQLMETNATSGVSLFSLDTRTPPKIKQKKKNNIKPALSNDNMENSHAGVAIPVDADELTFEETTKKLNFYKIEKPTTNSGLSTWILLSGQQVSSTSKPATRKPVIKPTENINTTLVVEPNKIIKPIFKKRVTSTTTTTTANEASTTLGTTLAPTAKETTTKLTKVKASMLANANKKTTTAVPVTKKPYSSSTTTHKPTTAKIMSTATPNVTTESNSDNSTLPAEAKNVETDLVTTDDKKNKRPSNNSAKRKKNKNRRRRPAEKSDNSTKIDKLKSKEKPIGTQLYNYLSREVMPTVGVGLVGLVVTAGLASYFLYPFGVARRSYEVDRRDKEGNYYYNNEYSGGIAEEEAIGKVIAGMPSNSLYGSGTTYTSKPARHRNRQVDHRIAPSYDYQPVTYNNPDVIEQSKEAAYAVDDQQQFVVGNTPKEEVTPAAVPEHGPRSLRLRRQVNEKENEIDSSTDHENSSTTSTTTEKVDLGEPTNNFSSYVQMFKELFKLKINLGLQLLQNATQAVSKYVLRVQQRFDEINRNQTVNIDKNKAW